MIIAIAVSSNLQGAATLVGDTTAILLGGYANMNFLDFFVYLGKPSIFFAVELGALCSAAILLVMFRKETASVPEPQVTPGFQLCAHDFAFGYHCTADSGLLPAGYA